jgi:hypothetical protein
MGCWNKTCALSNLPIFAGEEVYVFLIEQNGLNDTHCYSNHLYSPIITPFYSHYDDYGCGENNSGVALPVIINSLKKVLIEKELGENEYHDLEVKRDTLSEDNLFEIMQKGRLCVKNRYSNTNSNLPEENKVEFVMMRKDVVDSILANFKPECWDKDYKTIKIGFDEIIEDVDFAVEHIQEQFEEAKKRYENIGATAEEVMRLTNCLDTYLHTILENKGSKMANFISYFEPLCHQFSRIVPIMEIFTDFVKTGETTLAKEFLIDALKGAFIANFMEATRRSWIPQCGEGSQNIDTTGHKVLAQTVLNIIEKEESEREEWE